MTHGLPSFFKKILFICFVFFFCLLYIFVAAHGLSLFATSRDSSLVAVLRLLNVMASLVAEHRL